MTAPLAIFVPLYCALIGSWALVCGFRGTRLSPACLGGLVLLQLSASVRAVAEFVELATAPGGFGHGYLQPVVHVGYIASSVVVLPLVFTVAGGWTAAPRGAGSRPRSAEPTRARSARVWDGAIVALGCVALAVVTVRLGTTGRHT